MTTPADKRATNGRREGHLETLNRAGLLPVTHFVAQTKSVGRCPVTRRPEVVMARLAGVSVDRTTSTVARKDPRPDEQTGGQSIEQPLSGPDPPIVKI